MDEGKQFCVSSGNILDLDRYLFQNVSKDLLLKPGDVCNQGLANLFLQEHASSLPTDAPPDSLIRRELDERAATVAVKSRPAQPNIGFCSKS